MSQALTSLVDNPARVAAMAASAVPNISAMSAAGLCNLLGVCSLSRVFHAPLFHAAFSDNVLRK